MVQQDKNFFNKMNEFNSFIILEDIFASIYVHYNIRLIFQNQKSLIELYPNKNFTEKDIIEKIPNKKPIGFYLYRRYWSATLLNEFYYYLWYLYFKQNQNQFDELKKNNPDNIFIKLYEIKKPFDFWRARKQKRKKRK